MSRADIIASVGSGCVTASADCDSDADGAVTDVLTVVTSLWFGAPGSVHLLFPYTAVLAVLVGR
jgi:hypothetical protein